MSIRNELLADILNALGCSITDPNNRNLLLNDWLVCVGSEPVVYAGNGLNLTYAGNGNDVVYLGV